MSDPPAPRDASASAEPVQSIQIPAPAPQSQELALVQAVGSTLDALTRPFAEADKAKAREETRQTEIQTQAKVRETEIQAGLQKYNSAIVAGLAFAVLVFALVAMLVGNAPMAEKIVIAAVGFLGGYGFGRGQQPKPPA